MAYSMVSSLCIDKITHGINHGMLRGASHGPHHACVRRSSTVVNPGATMVTTIVDYHGGCHGGPWFTMMDHGRRRGSRREV